MTITRENDILQHFEKAIEYEWLETNGLGGWASSSIIGCHTRRYHGLLVAATQPPVERMNLVSKLEEAIVSNEVRYELGTNQFAQNTIYPAGFNYLESFSKTLYPEWIFDADGIRIKKSIIMLHNENTTLIKFETLEAPRPFTIELQPLISARGYHALQQVGKSISTDARFDDGIFYTWPTHDSPGIYISIPGGSFRKEAKWYYQFNYAVEKQRGQDFEEDLFCPGMFEITLKEGAEIVIMVTTNDPYERNANELFNQEIERRKKLLENQPTDKTFQQLLLAADQFIVKRNKDQKTVIAGYHWFTDWGRDTMISLPGLCLATGRYEDAKKMILAFAESISQGMLPNRFMDNNRVPEYNNVDATLWFFIAIHQYLVQTKDEEFVLQKLLPILKEIVQWHFKGTRYGIKVADNGLLYAGETGVQLTWMDAKVEDWVVTPRMGFAVEVQALWYNALNIYHALLTLNNEVEEAGKIKSEISKTLQSFRETFWNEEEQCLYDVIDGDKKDASIRPNQLFAISLPYSLVDPKQAKKILDCVSSKLYTPVGLRSLSPDDADYHPFYKGDLLKRDSAYHQGTVWSWLLGPYIDAIMKIENDVKSHALRIINDFKYHLDEAGIGTVSEIFDATEPFKPRGCIAQAWGVAEILRVMHQYQLFEDSASVN